MPFTAGSGTDIVARLVAEQARPGAGHQRDHRQQARRRRHAGRGAGGQGAGRRLHAAGPFGRAPGQPVDLSRTSSYDTLKDFAGVTPLASLPNVLVTAPDRFADVKDLVAQAKAKPGSFNYGSAGNGSATHMNAEVFRLAAGVQAQHVPFRGTPEAMTEVMGGRIDWFFAPHGVGAAADQGRQAQGAGRRHRQALGRAAAGAHHRRGRRAGLGVPVLGRPVRARPRRRKPVVERLQAEVAKIMAAPELKERLDKLGAEPFTMPSAQFDKFIVDETAKAQQVVKAAGIKVD